MPRTHHYTLAWCGLGASALALEVASLRSSNPDATLSAHARTLFDRNWFTRGVLIGASVWWLLHVMQPWGDR
jgi:hypothetical protein